MKPKAIILLLAPLSLFIAAETTFAETETLPHEVNQEKMEDPASDPALPPSNEIKISEPHTSSSSANAIYDLELRYENPIKAGKLNPQACLEFFRVSRPIMPLVNHIYIVAMEKKSAEVGSQPVAFVYGGSKGSSDLAYFLAHRDEIRQAPEHFRPLGSACGEKADHALEELSQISKKWQRKLSRNGYFIPRMLFTPALGRLCHVIGEEGIAAVQPYLTK